MSFTDEQLLNLVNNAILKKTEFKPEDFTGGSVQVTSTNNNKVTNYKVSLFFGYKSKKPITRTIEINEDSYYIWGKALMLKVLTLKNNNIGMDFSELNELMNNPSIVVSSEVVSKEVISIVEAPLQVDLPVEFTFSLKRDTHFSNLSKEYISNLEEYIRSCINSLPFEDFRDGCLAKNSYKYKNFKLAYNKWNKNYEPPKRTASNIEASLNVNVFDAIEARAKIDQQAQQEQGVIDA